MQLVLVFIFMWSLLFSIVYWNKAIKNVFAGEFSSWVNAAKHAIPYSIVWIDAFLRIFSPTHTGLW